MRRKDRVVGAPSVTATSEFSPPYASPPQSLPDSRRRRGERCPCRDRWSAHARDGTRPRACRRRRSPVPGVLAVADAHAAAVVEADPCAPPTASMSVFRIGQSEIASEPSRIPFVSRSGLATEPESRWSWPITMGAATAAIGHGLVERRGRRERARRTSASRCALAGLASAIRSSAIVIQRRRCSFSGTGRG